MRDALHTPLVKNPIHVNMDINMKVLLKQEVLTLTQPERVELLKMLRHARHIKN